MNKPKFTKGEWQFNGNDGSITDCTAAKNEIAIIHTENWDELGMGYANAHLIAAAPEMYEMLIECSNDLKREINPSDESSEMIERIDKLLAKARCEL